MKKKEIVMYFVIAIILAPILAYILPDMIEFITNIHGDCYECI